jgi:hypothetical protein
MMRKTQSEAPTDDFTELACKLLKMPTSEVSPKHRPRPKSNVK